MFTKYIETFLSLLERFVVAQEKRNELLSASKSYLDGATTALEDEQRVHTPKAEEASASTSNGSASDAATTTRGRGRSRAAVAGSDAQEKAEAEIQHLAEEIENEDTAPPPANNGRRQRVRASAAVEETPAEEVEEKADTGAGSAGRRQRVRAPLQQQQQQEAQPEKPKVDPSKDTPDQADLRTDIENDLILAADVDEANALAKKYMSERGWASGADVPVEELEATFQGLEEIIDLFFK